MYIHVNIFKIYTVCVYIHNKYTQYTNILRKQKRLFESKYSQLIIWQH